MSREGVQAPLENKGICRAKLQGRLLRTHRNRKNPGLTGKNCLLSRQEKCGRLLNSALVRDQNGREARWCIFKRLFLYCEKWKCRNRVINHHLSFLLTQEANIHFFLLYKSQITTIYHFERCSFSPCLLKKKYLKTIVHVIFNSIIHLFNKYVKAYVLCYAEWTIWPTAMPRGESMPPPWECAV